jgi:hypothetical protein
MAVAVGAITTKYLADNLCFRKTGAWCIGFFAQPGLFQEYTGMSLRGNVEEI